MSENFWIIFFMALAAVSVVGVLIVLPDLLEKLRGGKM